MEAAALLLIEELHLYPAKNCIASKATALWSHRSPTAKLTKAISEELGEAFAHAVRAAPTPSDAFRSAVAQSVALAAEVADAALCDALAKSISEWLAAGAHRADFDSLKDHIGPMRCAKTLRVLAANCSAAGLEVSAPQPLGTCLPRLSVSPARPASAAKPPAASSSDPGPCSRRRPPRC
jgi:hypothetical protein